MMPGMSKEIWVPKSETRVTVRDGVVTPWQEMSFAPKPVSSPTAGFAAQATKEPR